MIKELFAKQQKALSHFFDRIDKNAIETFVDILKKAPGMIILTGIGKSGLIAEKIALTLTSTGTRACYLSPVNALHGDIGIVSNGDAFIMLSKSGESDELLHMVPFLRNKGATLIAVVNKDGSRLAKACDFSVVLPIETELCPFDLAPTTSAVTQLLLGDIISIALMRLKNFSLDDYAKNHPSGKIGRRLTLRVSDLMLKGDDIPKCSPKDTIVSKLVELSNKRCGCLLVADEKNVLGGIFTDGDLRRALLAHGSKALDKSIEEVMTRTPRHTEASTLAEQALKIMEGDQKHPVTVLPVLDESRKIIGLIKMHDIIQSGL